MSEILETHPVPTTGPEKNPWAVAAGRTAGKTHALNNIQRRVEDIVDAAPELTPDQLARLHRILTTAVRNLEPVVAGGGGHDAR